MWLKRLNREQENFRAALRWLIEHKETKHALRLSGALHWYCYMRGYLGESLSWLQAALQLSNTGDRTVARAKVLSGAGMLTLYRGNSAEAHALLEESIALHKALGDTAELAFAIMCLGEVYEVQEDYLTARSLMEESVALSRKVGDKWMLAVALHVLSQVVWAQGNALLARALLEESWGLAQELGEKWGETRIFPLGWQTYLDSQRILGPALKKEPHNRKVDKCGTVFSQYTSPQPPLHQNVRS